MSGEVDLEEIKAAHPRNPHECPTCREYHCAACPVYDLVAEVERLREEATEAHKERLDKAVTSRTVAALDDALQAAVAENRRLREALRLLTSSWEDASIGRAVRRGPWLDREEFKAIQRLAPALATDTTEEP